MVRDVFSSAPRVGRQAKPGLETNLSFAVGSVRRAPQAWERMWKSEKRLASQQGEKRRWPTDLRACAFV